MRAITSRILLALLAASLPAVRAQTAAQSPVASATEQGRAVIQKELAPKVPGLDIAVGVDGAIVWSEGFGYADLASKAPVTVSTRFRIGSVSKPLTAAGLALLVERGQIDMDAPIQKYVADFPQKDGVITLRLLAGHLSGIRNYHGMEALSDKPYPNLRAGLKIFEDDPLESAPGAKFSYSSYNWNVVGVAMESASKQEFLRYMDENVFKPLGMTNTGPDLAGAADPRRTHFYETDSSGKFVAASAVDSSYKWPSGGFLSTPEDLARFGFAHLKPGFFKGRPDKLLFVSQKTLDGTVTHYGVGWFIGQTIVYHTGDSVGGAAVLLLLPQSRVVVAIACNRGSFVVSDSGEVSLTQRAGDLKLATVAHNIADLFAPVHLKQ